jgi:phospho-N-acetylmuramoyl-pentapeptide-transferase
VAVWLPFTAQKFTMAWQWYLPMATVLLWFTVNATNCSDGVDGLAGSLTLIALGSLAALLYGIVGYRPVAEYLLIPHSAEGARWAIMLFTAAGGLAAYLWYNAEPSTVLMGDAGSRMLGLLVGIGVLASGNPLLVFVVSPVVLANGGAGLCKLVLLRLLKRLGLDTTPPGASGRPEPRHAIVRALHCVRFPLHDHCRRNLGWSNAQVLMRFMLIQAFLTPVLFILYIKIR